jgi:hypothetical protein
VKVVLHDEVGQARPDESVRKGLPGLRAIQNQLVALSFSADLIIGKPPNSIGVLSGYKNSVLMIK